ncbi:unnamed protein product [Phyllotreta striolata]|uniref:Pecanex-like protein n=1 Tax=Phyllotreta striolata TaxID=444603 RepID=A0A9N9XPJ0_PHYSR|nr:unnamed protein product [Phyllotreta striolata]
MIEENQMGSQILEIIRQGIWASFTGGWFYDPRQDVFCNTFHLYIWLYLLSVPFCIYVYFPSSLIFWYFYCGSVTIVLAVLKLVNFGLHRMYDTKECIQEEVQVLKKEDEGIELQILSSKLTDKGATSVNHNESEFPHFRSIDESIECICHQKIYEERTQKLNGKGNERPASTIDFTAEVHRKNSSESDATPNLLSIESDNDSNIVHLYECGWSHSNFTNLNYLPTTAHIDIKPTGSHNHLTYAKSKPNKMKSVPYSLNLSKYHQTTKPSTSRIVDMSSQFHPNIRELDSLRDSTNSEGKLLGDIDNSNSSSTFDVQEAAMANNTSDKNLSFSNSSIEIDEKVETSLRRRQPSGSRRGHVKEKDTVKHNRRKRIAYSRRNRTKPKSNLQNRRQEKFSSLLELDLDWLFEDNQSLQNKDSLKRDTEWSSTIAVPLERDIEDQVEDPGPSTSSLGAIPKRMPSKNRERSTSAPRKFPKSESKKCRTCGCKPNPILGTEKTNAPLTENKLTQTQLQRCTNDASIDVSDYTAVSHYHSDDKIDCDYSKSNVQLKNEDGSSNGSNNELSTLLPPVPLLSVFLQPRSENIYCGCNSSQIRRKRINNNVERRRSMQGSKENISKSMFPMSGSHNTKSNCLFCQLKGYDEHDRFYILPSDIIAGGGGQNSQNNGSGTSCLNQPVHLLRQSSLRLPSQQRSIDIWNSTESVSNSSASLQKSNRPAGGSEVIRQELEIDRLLVDVHNESKFKCLTSDPVDNNYKRTKTYYVFRMWPWSYIKVSTDRLKLLALLDRNLSLIETLLSIIIGSTVGILGAILLFRGYYKDMSAFVLCLVIASCQYSLIKSVQPDAASPTHGFNRIITYSRPLYFCLFSILALIIDSLVLQDTRLVRNTGVALIGQRLLLLFNELLINFILIFPLLFSLGLFPQINTFLMYLLEQIDMHVFGGNAVSSLSAALYCFIRSCLATLVLGGLAYFGLNESKGAQHVLFSAFCAFLISISYHLSRSSSDPAHIWKMFKGYFWPSDDYREELDKIQSSPLNKEREERGDVEVKSRQESGKTKECKIKTDKTAYSDVENDTFDYLPAKLQKLNNARLKHDIIVCSLIGVFVFSIHTSTVFTVLQPELSPVLWSVSATLGFLLHYIIPQLRKHLPWLCIARPILRSLEYEQYQVKGPSKIMWFEKVYIYFSFLERNIFYPLLFLSVLTEDAPRIVTKYGTLKGSFVIVICGIKCLRSSYSNQSSQYLILVFTALCYKFDLREFDESFLVIQFFVITIFSKMHELLLKIHFVVTYIAPWQITWGSAFHAFAQPLSVPHSAVLFLQVMVAACLSMPLNPFLGSVIFIMSYARPVKFWERDYNTRRVDHSNTPLSSHLDRNLGADDNNLNSLFYEHLTRSLQHSLCGDLKMGRWGEVNQGDCFVLASDYLNCLVHIIEMGNDVMTFQMRGLEFRGTYCQQREVEAITEGVEENDGCCCCDTGHLPNILSINAAFNQRWLAWEVLASKYVLEGYSISDNSASSILQVFEFRKALVSYYVKSIIFYLIRSPKLSEWLTNPTISKALSPMELANFVDLDPIFNYNIDEDFDMSNCGITLHSFLNTHGDWIKYCVERHEQCIEAHLNGSLTLLCFALSLLGRRTLGTASHNTASGVEFFLNGLHALFKGDFRISCARDEWIFTDVDLLKSVVAPGIKMSLKLHQDHFMSPEEYKEHAALYEAICKHQEELVISHEGDPVWRQGVLSGAPSLLTLRHVLDEGSDEYKIIMLNKRYLSFRVIKLNKECVRGLWAGQQQELVYFRNRNPERGSIQNAKQALRNIINSSCDQPIGYPIYVSPLTTSFAETNEQYSSIIGGLISLKKIRKGFLNTFRRVMRKPK